MYYLDGEDILGEYESLDNAGKISPLGIHEYIHALAKSIRGYYGGDWNGDESKDTVNLDKI